MTDRRFHRANARVGHAGLIEAHPGLRLTEGTTRRVGVPVADLCAAPDGGRDKQMLFGQAFTVLEDHEGWAFGFDPTDGYVGYLPSPSLSEPVTATHRVTARSSHLYTRADIKSADLMALSYGSLLAVTGETGETGAFVELATGGFVPRQHVAPLGWVAADPVAQAEAFLGTPYLWGGNNGAGIDCSGLVQQALLAAGVPCPRDSDLQSVAWPEITGPAQRGDLVFWKGHVAMMVSDTDMIHANAHHMAVAVEPFAEARARIQAKEFGDVLRIPRPAR